MGDRSSADRWLIWVSFPWATFGLEVDEDQTVVDAPPIARYTVGWGAGHAKSYFLGRGARVVVLSLKRPVPPY